MSRQRFEYRYIQAGKEDVNEVMDSYAMHGWEVHTLNRNHNATVVDVLFSRRVGPLYAGSDVERIAGEHKISAQPVAGTVTGRIHTSEPQPQFSIPSSSRTDFVEIDR